MKIALVGYGKMGQAIEIIAQNKGHEITARLKETPTKENLNDAQVVIEFSQPEAAFENISAALALGVPVISGTTGWLDRLEEAQALALKNNTAFLYGSNFSLGVNLFFALNEQLSKLMSRFNEYRVQMEEIHHTHKKDAPSGTAISLAEGVIANHSEYESWKLHETEKEQIGIYALREDEVPGTHSVYYRSDVDEIEIKHTAHSRSGFALGAVLAAEWIADKKGVFSMKDVLSL